MTLYSSVHPQKLNLNYGHATHYTFPAAITQYQEDSVKVVIHPYISISFYTKLVSTRMLPKMIDWILLKTVSVFFGSIAMVTKQ